MPRKEQYYFGTRLKEVDIFAFPRTGSHLLAYCFSGLFDSVSLLPEVHRIQPEAISRQDELADLALYGLELREQGVPFQPVWLNPLLNGVHGMPVAGEHPVLILIRNPIAATFSAWRARKRLAFQLETPANLSEHLDRYENFYDAGMKLIAAGNGKALLVRYEDLLDSSETLERIVEFVGLQPKLSPEFVHWITRFDNFTKKGERGFYRAGNDEAWRESDEFCSLLASAGPPRDFRRFGYEIAYRTLVK